MARSSSRCSTKSGPVPVGPVGVRLAGTRLRKRRILALFGTPEQKTRYLQPLLDGDITSCYSMTEPQGGS